MLLVPAFYVFLLWPNGIPLMAKSAGEDFRRVFTGNSPAVADVILTVVLLLLIVKTVGWILPELNSLDYNLTPQFGIWPYPFMFAGWLVHNTAFRSS